MVNDVDPGNPGSSPVNTLYGNTSNGVVIVDMDGKVVFFANWYRFDAVDKFLTELGTQQGWLSE